jgi:cell shape-determining protein MreC
MIGTFFSNEIWTLIVSIAPAVGSVLATVISAVMAIRKVASTIAEFKQSNELKQNNENISALLEDNRQLKKMNEKLLVELTKIKPAGWCDDKEK